jgi:hypothetical protein
MTSYGSPTFRAAYVEATGEVYVMQHEGLPGGGRVEVVATRDGIDGVLAELAGMDEICGEPGSLWWLLDRLGDGARAEPFALAHAARAHAGRSRSAASSAATAGRTTSVRSRAA